MEWDNSTISFQQIYGPAGGNGNPPADSATGPMAKTYFGLELPTLIALGVVVWWVIKKLE